MFDGNLDALIEQWRVTDKNSQSKFYNENIWSLVKEKFLNDFKKTDNPDLLIVLVGTSPEPLILSISALKPKRINFVYTEETESVIDIICHETEYTLSQIDKVRVNGSYPDETYQKLKEIFDKNQNCKIAVDITGGKKAMVAAAVLSSFTQNIKCYYVDFKEYIPDLRRPKPGSEFLSELSNPYQVFGCLEERDADSLFNRCNYTAANFIYQNLNKKIPDPRSVEIKSLISQGYLNWDEFNFADAQDYLNQAIQKLEQYRFPLKNKEILITQNDILNQLKYKEKSENSLKNLLKDKNYFEYLVLSMLAKSERLGESGQYGIAVLCLYRIMELISQHRLAIQNIDSAKVPAEIRNKYDSKFRKVTNEIFGNDSGIPDEISLIHSWILLYVMNDDFVKDEKNAVFLKKMRAETKIRNGLWIEHGNTIINKDDFIHFKTYVENWVVKAIPDYSIKINKYKFIKF